MLTDERLAELREEAEEANLTYSSVMLPLLDEIDRLRGEVARLECVVGLRGDVIERYEAENAQLRAELGTAKALALFAELFGERSVVDAFRQAFKEQPAEIERLKRSLETAKRARDEALESRVQLSEELWEELPREPDDPEVRTLVGAIRKLKSKHHWAVEEVNRCHARLEIDHVFTWKRSADGDLDTGLTRVDIAMEGRDLSGSFDAISCGDAMIALLKEELDEACARLDARPDISPEDADAYLREDVQQIDAIRRVNAALRAHAEKVKP